MKPTLARVAVAACLVGLTPTGHACPRIDLVALEAGLLGQLGPVSDDRPTPEAKPEGDTAARPEPGQADLQQGGVAPSARQRLAQRADVLRDQGRVHMDMIQSRLREHGPQRGMQTGPDAIFARLQHATTQARDYAENGNLDAASAELDQAQLALTQLTDYMLAIRPQPVFRPQPGPGGGPGNGQPVGPVAPPDPDGNVWVQPADPQAAADAAQRRLEEEARARNAVQDKRP